MGTFCAQQEAQAKACTQAHLTRVCSLHTLVEWHVHASTPSQTLTHQARRPTFFQWTAHIIHHPKPAAAAADHGGSHTPGVTHTLTRPHGATVGPHRATQYGAGGCVSRVWCMHGSRRHSGPANPSMLLLVTVQKLSVARSCVGQLRRLLSSRSPSSCGVFSSPLHTSRTRNFLTAPKSKPCLGSLRLR